MIDLDLQTVAAAIALLEPLAIRTIAFDMPTFDLLKGFQRKLESRIRRDTSNAEVIKYLIHTHPESENCCGRSIRSTGNTSGTSHIERFANDLVRGWRLS